MNAFVNIESRGFSEEEYEDVKRCLETLLAVRAGTQPLDRNLGIDIDHVTGYPVPVARNMLSLEIIEKVNIYEPRVEVASIEFNSDTDGHLNPVVHFKKREE